MLNYVAEFCTMANKGSADITSASCCIASFKSLVLWG